MSLISYQRGYKYQLYAEHEFSVSGIDLNHNWESPVKEKHLHFIDVVEASTGQINIKAKKGYAWDGPSGPTLDTKTFMRGSLYHDILYQLINESVIPNTNRKRADEILREICLEDGMSRVRAWWVFRAVRRFGKYTFEPRKVIIAGKEK